MRTFLSSFLFLLVPFVVMGSNSTTCSVRKQLYQNPVLGTSCCKDSSQPWCDPLSRLDRRSLLDLVEAQPNFGSALNMLEKVSTVWMGSDTPLKTTLFMTGFRYDQWVRRNDMTPDEFLSNVNESGGFYSNVSGFEFNTGGVYGEFETAFTTVSVFITNFELGSGDTGVFVKIKIDLFGRVKIIDEEPYTILVGAFPHRNELTGLVIEGDKPVAQFTTIQSLIGNDGWLPMTDLAVGVRNIIMTTFDQPPEGVCCAYNLTFEDPVNVENAMVFTNPYIGPETVIVQLLAIISSNAPTLVPLFLQYVSNPPTTGPTTHEEIKAFWELNEGWTEKTVSDAAFIAKLMQEGKLTSRVGLYIDYDKTIFGLAFMGSQTGYPGQSSRILDENFIKFKNPRSLVLTVNTRSVDQLKVMTNEMRGYRNLNSHLW